MTKTDRVRPSGIALLLLGFTLTGPAALAADPAGLIASLKSPRRLERVAAAWELGEIRETSAVATLVAALEDQDAGVRLWAARSLVKIGAPAVEPLLAVLGRQDLKKGLASDYLIPALGELKDPRALSALVLVVVRGKDRDFQAHQEYRAAIMALAGFGGQAFDPLLAALRLMDHPPQATIGAMACSKRWGTQKIRVRSMPFSGQSRRDIPRRSLMTLLPRLWGSCATPGRWIF